MTVLQVYGLDSGRVLRRRGLNPPPPPPPPSTLRLLNLSGSGFGTAPPPPPPGYDPLVWPYGPVETYTPSSASTGVPAGTVLTTIVPSQYGSLSANVLTISANNVTIDSKYIPFYLKINGNNCKITRCEIVGGTSWANPNSASALVDHRNMTQTGLFVADSSIHQQVPNYSMNAFIGHHATVDRCDIYHCVDGFGIYNNNAAISPVTGETYKNDGDCIIRGNWIHDFSFFHPDPFHSSTDNITHNDGVQFHGGKRTQILGNFFDWYAAPAAYVPFNATAGSAYQSALEFHTMIDDLGTHVGGIDSTATANRGYGSGILVNTVVSTPTGNTIRGNLFRGCQAQLAYRVSATNYVGQNRFTPTSKLWAAPDNRYIIRTNQSIVTGGFMQGLFTNVWDATGAALTYDTSNPVNGRGGIRADAG